jgi:hypothetical protein
VAQRIIYSGDAGTRFTNETGRVLYQFIAALQNTCGLCLQYHLKISAAWPIPMHYGCRCIQRMVKPGQQAQHEFCDYRKLLDAMPEHDKAAAIGASNYRLLKSGLATWEDIVTPNRVRDFREVVAKKKLTVKQMVAHGVKPYQAQEAYSAVHTTEHQAAEQHRRELLQKLTGAGLSQENLVNELSKRLAARVTVASGPEGPYTSGPAWAGGPLPGGGGSSAAELAGLIGAWRPTRQRAAMPKAPKPAPPKPPEPKPQKEPEEKGQFGPTEASIEIERQHQASVDREIRRLLGPSATVQDAANLTGATADASISMSVSDGNLVIKVTSPRYFAERIIKQDSAGRIYLKAENLFIKPEHTGGGLWAEIFGRMVENGIKQRLDRIDVYAYRSSSANGYYTWPRFGYDGPVPEHLLPALPNAVRGATKLSEVMASERGRSWWKANGVSIDLTFDLKPGSPNLKDWKDYLREKQARRQE